MFHQEVQTAHSEEQNQGVRTTVLGKADMVGHEGQGKSAREGNRRGERSGKEVKHGDGEGSEDQRDDAEIPLGFCKGIKKMG